MNEFMLNDNAGRDHLQELIAEAEQERFANSVAKAQGKTWSFSRVTPALKKALHSIMR